jgi:hypothetical protein
MKESESCLLESSGRNPLKPAEFQVLDNPNFDWQPIYRFWIISIGNRYPYFDKAVGFKGTTLEVLVNRNQPAEQCCEEKRRQLKQTVVMPDFENNCQPSGEAS